MTRPALPAVALLFLTATRAPAADPLDCVPDTAQAVVVADDPRKLAEAVTTHAAFKDAQAIAPIRRLYDTAEARKALQLLAFAEFGLGAKWPQLLDDLAGNGVALAFRFGPNAPALLVLSGKDAAKVTKAYAVAWTMIEQELTRQGVEEKPTKEMVAGAEVTRIGKDVHAAKVGATVLVSNNADALKAAIERATADRDKARAHPARKAALGILPNEPLAWLWVDLASVTQSKEAKDFFDATRKDFLQTLVAGATIDCVRRSEFLAVGLYKEGDGFRAALRLPAGRDGLWPELTMHVPPKGMPGSLPQLEPPGTVYSHSLHLDVAYLWKNRAKLVNDQTRADIEKAEKDISRVLPGSAKLGELLEMWGPHHRVVVVNHDTRPYKKEPGTKLPAFGYVGTARDKQFLKSVDVTLRAAGLVGALQYGLKMTEHEHEGVMLVAYRFPENKELADDPDGLRFNFEPCFAVVGDELVVASTAELGKKLITELKKPRTGTTAPALVRGKLFAKGAADALAGLADPLVTDTVLRQGIGLAEARKEVAELVAFVKTLGAVRMELDIVEKEYRVDVVWDTK